MLHFDNTAVDGFDPQRDAGEIEKKSGKRKEEEKRREEEEKKRRQTRE